MPKLIRAWRCIPCGKVCSTKVSLRYHYEKEHVKETVR